jgi:hypothetical protein
MQCCRIWIEICQVSLEVLLTLVEAMFFYELGTSMGLFSGASRPMHYVHLLSLNLGTVSLTTGSPSILAGLACGFRTCKLLVVHGRKLSVPLLLRVFDALATSK